MTPVWFPSPPRPGRGSGATLSNPIGEGLGVRRGEVSNFFARQISFNSACSGVVWTMSSVGLRCRAAEIWAAQQRPPYRT